MGKTVMWFRKDLRFDDNTAFSQMVEHKGVLDELICVFQLDPIQFRPDSLNHAAFFSSLKHFQEMAAKKKRKIHFLYGAFEQSFKELKRAYPDWDHVYFNKDERGYGRIRDQKARAFFTANHIQVHSFQDSHLHGVEEIKKPNGESYKVFTPYFRKWQSLPKLEYKHGTDFVADFTGLEHEMFTRGEESYQAIIKNIEIPFDYHCGEQIAEEFLREFIENQLHEYHRMRDFPAKDGTSKLSRFLRTGEISIRKVWHAVWAEPDSDGKQAFVSELCWRDFYNMIYFENPKQKNQEVKSKYRALNWSYNEAHFSAWKNGYTGYPIVDAAMRQLNQTGWMHNRLRMIVASFLTKDLLINWRHGEKYFQEKLIDYDSASNIGGWQWAASTGTDAVPYFRIFNPVKQSEKFDIDGLFIREFIPELERVPNQYIHEPNKMPQDIQKLSGCVIGESYPLPIVDHSKQRARILAFFKESIE